jgi:hypothetical protein
MTLFVATTNCDKNYVSRLQISLFLFMQIVTTSIRLLLGSFTGLFIPFTPREILCRFFKGFPRGLDQHSSSSSSSASSSSLVIIIVIVIIFF